MEVDRSETIEDRINRELADAMHDVRVFNATIRRNVAWVTEHIQFDKFGHPITLQTEVADTVRQQLGSILRAAQLLSTRLAFVDYETNPEVLRREAVHQAKVYSKFDKAKLVLITESRQQQVPIRLSGSSHRTIDAYPSFDTLPFLLIENALKYAPTGTEVNIAFEEYNGDLYVYVQSIGPVVEVEEKELLFDKHFRGKNAIACQSMGNGFGLYFSDVLASLHGIGLNVSCGEELYKVNGIPFGKFEVMLHIPR